MVLYPEVQKKAQAEIVQVLGDRLPEFSDKGSIPYVDAVMMEVLRWRPVTPIGMCEDLVNPVHRLLYARRSASSNPR